MNYQSKDTEKTVKQNIRLALGKLCVLFTNPVGLAWVGKTYKFRAKESYTSVILHQPRQVSFGLHPGSSDLIGWKSFVVSSDMVGKRFAQFVAIEVKAEDGKATDKQLQFIERVSEAGGLAGVARSAQEALGIIGEGN